MARTGPGPTVARRSCRRQATTPAATPMAPVSRRSSIGTAGSTCCSPTPPARPPNRAARGSSCCDRRRRASPATCSRWARTVSRAVPSTKAPRLRSVLAANTADWMWVDSLDAFAIAADTAQGTTVTFWNADFTYQPYQPVTLPGAAQDGPGLVRAPDGHAPVPSTDPCGSLALDLVRATSNHQAPTGLTHFGVTLTGFNGCQSTQQATDVLNGFAMPSPDRTMDLLVDGKFVDFERATRRAGARGRHAGRTGSRAGRVAGRGDHRREGDRGVHQRSADRPALHQRAAVPGRVGGRGAAELLHSAAGEPDRVGGLSGRLRPEHVAALSRFGDRAAWQAVAGVCRRRRGRDRPGSGSAAR